MANMNILKGQLVEKGKNVEWMAEILGVTTPTAYRKLNNLESMTIGEAAKIKTALSMSDEKAIEAFL